MSKRYCLALDLKDDESLIAEYEKHHKAVWPSILASIKDSGITEMEIYRTGTRLFMIMETDDSFSFEKKSAADKSNPDVEKWEDLMSAFQQAIPTASPGEKWVLMKNIFKLTDQ